MIAVTSSEECLFQALQTNLITNQMMMVDPRDVDDDNNDEEEEDDYDDDLSERRLSSARKARLEIVLSLDNLSYLYCIRWK